MRDLLQEDKRGISIMIGYVLLVVIAIGLSVIVFAYLKLYLPKDEPKCEVDISLTIESVECLDEQVTISLRNNGLFTVDGAFIRIGEQGRIFKTLLNTNHQLIGKTDGLPEERGLKPDDLPWERIYDYTQTQPNGFVDGGAFEVEVEPFIFVENQAALCPEATVQRNIICTTTP